MNTKDTGGPAFPAPGLNNLPNGDFIFPESGMTLLDYFAAKAMEGDWASCNAGRNRESMDEAAQRYYEMAAAMMRARRA